MVNESQSRLQKLPEIQDGNELVISGISGRFPESDNLYQLQENLMNKVDLITGGDRRWTSDDPGIPDNTGKINNVEKFDALFFGIHYKQVQAMDPMSRILLEVTYEAIVDAGVNPKSLSGTNTGVFIGTCYSETEIAWFRTKRQTSGFGLTGCSRAMFSNRISYWLDVKGPSYTLDSACSSSLTAIEHAYRTINAGLCENAIVGGCNLCLYSYVSEQFFKLGVLSSNGRCKTFDESADGYGRSETVGAIFLQKAKDAKRIYATVVHAKTNCDGYKEQSITFPSSKMQTVLLQDFYAECGIPPTKVEYVEAHGTGTKVGDPEEVRAIDKVFCKGRKTPLKIGAVKSNLGHTEPASGICSIAKVIIGMETGKIPPNLNFKRAKKTMSALVDKRLTVVTEPTPWDGGYAGINSFGFGGANTHILLKSHDKEKVNNGQPEDNLPRLVAVSGRTEEAVQTILNDLNQRSVDVEFVSLLHGIHSDNISNHLYRGYTLLPAKGIAQSPIQDIQSLSSTKRPIWFVFTGMGSHWPTMGDSLLDIPIFAAAIEKCDAVLKPLGLDIYHIITTKDKSVFDNILNSFVGIAAVQIGLVDILRALGVVPDYIIGHSVGELGCAYADGCFTAEQMILAAYSRGLVSIQTKVVYGSMAAIGLGYQELKKLCPPGIEVACHNSSTNATISGPADLMKSFVAELQAKNIFAKEVLVSNIPYHSSYIAPLGPKLLALLHKIIPEPKPRSSKWCSSSIPVDRWEEPLAQFSSAEYHVNNLLNPVLFEETSSLIHDNAIAIEIAPHGLLQAILRRSLSPEVKNIAMTQRGTSDKVQFLLQSLGAMYNSGINLKLENLYPRVEFPVSRSTPMIAPLIRWEHSADWLVMSAREEDKIDSCERAVELSLLPDDSYEFIKDHVIDGRIFVPGMALVFLTWETISMTKCQHFTKTPVVFEDISFLRAVPLTMSGSVTLKIVIQKGSGKFEIIDGDVALVTGTVRAIQNPNDEKIDSPIPTADQEILLTDDVYKELRLRGYEYGEYFRGIMSVNTRGTRGHIAWEDNWSIFMDNMLQLAVIGNDTRSLFLPTGIKKLVIDPELHMKSFKEIDQKKCVTAYVNDRYQTITSGGIQMRQMKASAVARKKARSNALCEEYRFIPYLDKSELMLSDLARIITHICVENNTEKDNKIVEIIKDEDSIFSENNLFPLISESIDDMPLVNGNIQIITSNPAIIDSKLPESVSVIQEKKLNADSKILLLIACELFSNNSTETLSFLISSLREGGFLLVREKTRNVVDNINILKHEGLEIVLHKRFQKETFILLRKSVIIPQNFTIINVSNNNFDWVDDMREKVTEELNTKPKESIRILLVGQGDPENGLLGLFTCLRKEIGSDVIRGLLIQDPKAPEFSLENPFYHQQIKKDLSVNVLNINQTWGSYRHLPLTRLQHKSVPHAYVNPLLYGDLSSLTWIKGEIDSWLNNKKLVRIYYSAINFKDVMLATGKLAAESFERKNKDQECVIGLEYSGVDKSGKRVMGLLKNRGIANICVPDDEFLWEVPATWTLEAAATVPCVYATCYYALFIKGRMKKGDKVLIHSGAGGVGQAAINLALHEGCEVFTTVGTVEKRRFILTHFPQIREDHIGNSRDCSFEKLIIDRTNGKGVDIVLNSLTGSKLQASVNCLAWGGRFLEIGKFDLVANEPLGMEHFLREISFQGVMLDHVMSAATSEKLEVTNLLNEGLKNGAIKPLVRTVFSKDQIEAAFRLMAAGKHIGKVLIKIRGANEAANSAIFALPRYHCFNDCSYIVFGGLGGFGLELSDWLIRRGAKKLVLISRNGVKTGYQKMRIELWENLGVRVSVIVGKDASLIEDCEFILKAAEDIAPVDGIFNLAAVLKDAAWNDQTPKSFEISFRAKAIATKNLDKLTRKLCPVLRHFVVFSSMACGRGNIGQTNYAMSNSVMERICERRNAEGLPALAIQWGLIGDVGIVADMYKNQPNVTIGGSCTQSIVSCLNQLDGFLMQKQPIVSSMILAEKRIRSENLNMVDSVLHVMGLKSFKGVNMNATFAELGMDSLMFVETKQLFEREFQIFMTVQEIRNLSFIKLMKMNENPGENKMKNRSIAEQNVDIMKLLIRVVGNEYINPETCIRLSDHGAGKDEVFLIPGIEGISPVFSTIAEKLQAPATCLQFKSTENFNKSIFEMAENLLPYILEKKGQGKITVAGYSYGSLIATEIVRKLEAKGFSCRLIMIDGSERYLKKITDELIPSTNDEQLQDSSLLCIMSVIATQKLVFKFAENLRSYSSWEDKLEAFVANCPSELEIPPENQRILCTGIYYRLRALKKYDVSQLPRIKAPITFFKPTEPMTKSMEFDYGVSKLTSGKVKVITLEGNHLTMLDHNEVPRTISGAE